ncbi:uncharacterized protein M6B38_300000 [Iris pallida]|uniref:Uncharacterized protein n=1 Tax=Iris pallida TaxID=29817 RepID=A0AAX6HQX7_IRIPA|nr:uncharacterized protein M6B38_300000 [Iris pallida]
MEQAPPELKRAEPEKINLRKSLAWDRAFFTSQGVLETEELGIVNSTFGKAHGRKLAGIQEGLRKSSESTSTMDSESYALESLEVGLLDNVRASIRMSLGKCDKKASDTVSDVPRLVCKKADLVNKMKPPVNLKKDGVTKQQQQCASKKAVTGVKAAAKGSGQSKSLSRPPRIVPKPMSMVPSSKSFAGSKKISSGIGVNQQSVVASEKTNGNSCSATSRPNSSAIRTPGSRPGTAVFSTSSCTAISRPNSSAKRTPGSRPGTAVFSTSSSYSSPALGATRKGSALRNSGHFSGSTTKTPTPKSKPAPSTLRFSSKVSTHSSVDSVVSESSSTTSSRTKLSNSVESLSASSTSSRSMAVPSDVESSQAPGTCVRKQTSGTLSQSHHIAARAGPRALSDPSTRDLQRSGNTGSRCPKPSGLRVPSPNIGYFDAEKTQVRSSNKISQTSLRNSLAKSTVGTSNNISGANKLKPTKTPPATPAAKRATMKFDSPKTHSIPKSPNHSMSPASPVLLFQQKEPAQPHSEDNHNIAEVADMVHPSSVASIHTKDGSAVLGEGQHPEGAYKKTETTYQASKELKHEQSPLSLDFQDEHMQNIVTVAHKSEKENILPACETNSVNQDCPTEGKSISAVLGEEHSVGTYKRTTTIYQASKVLKHEQLPCLLDGQDEHLQKILPAYEMNVVTRHIPTEGRNHGPEAFLAFSF